jgi:UDP-N-acetylmuramoylalanine--D-glutamate ligase
MLPVTCFAGRTVAVFGLGRSGLASVEALRVGGAHVIAWDDSDAPRESAAARGMFLQDLREVDFSAVDALVLAPGVPLTHPEPHWTVRRAREHDVGIIGDTELLVRELAGRARLVAITGTNGKSTTTALVAHILGECGCDVRIGGNIGTPVLALDPPEQSTVYVIEFSSYQIDLTPSLRPDVGVLLNISPDHLDRHGTLEHYAAVKARIFARLEDKDVAVIGIDDELCTAIASGLPTDSAVCRISGGEANDADVKVRGHCIYRTTGGSEAKVADLNNIATLRGVHNGQNAAAAVAAAEALGVPCEDVVQALSSFAGLAHRMEDVGRLGEVLFVNDSKATNADAAACALASFERIYWIVGGQAKAGGIQNLKEFFPKIEKAYLIGEAAEQFSGTLQNAVPHEACGTLEQAVPAAARDALAAGGEVVVLLSPACASFDQYANFEIRGEAFRQAVHGLRGIVKA